MISKLEKLLGPIANKLAQQRHLQAISSGMMMSLGLIVVGSVFLIIANPPINLDLVDLNTGNIFLKFLISWKQFALANYDVLTLPYNYTMGLVGLISAFGVAYCLAESYKMKASVYGIISMCTFLIGCSSIKGWSYYNELFRCGWSICCFNNFINISRDFTSSQSSNSLYFSR